MYLIAIGEIYIKGKNRINFERRLIRNIRSALQLEEQELIKFRNRYIIKTSKNIEKLKTIFGIAFYVKVEQAKTNLKETALSIIKNEKSFRISAKKSLSLKKSSTELNEEIGSYIVEKKNLKVDLENPEINIKIEELRNNFYLYKTSDIVRCLNGLPVGTGGFIHLKVKDELKSTVTGFLLMKRGCIISLSRELQLLNKFAHGFNIRTREEKETDIIATDETLKDLKEHKDSKMILRPLIGYSEKEVKKIYNLIESI